MSKKQTNKSGEITSNNTSNMLYPIDINNIFIRNSVNTNTKIPMSEILDKGTLSKQIIIMYKNTVPFAHTESKIVAQSIFNMIRTATNGRFNYTVAEITGYLTQVGELVKLHSALTKLYGYMNYVTLIKPQLRSRSIFKNWKMNMEVSSRFSREINRLAMYINTLPIPSQFPIFTLLDKIHDKLYKMADREDVGFYTFLPKNLFINRRINEQLKFQSAQLTSLDVDKLLLNQMATMKDAHYTEQRVGLVINDYDLTYLWKSITNEQPEAFFGHVHMLIESLIEFISNNEVFSIVSADFTKVFEGKISQLEYIPNDYVIVPELESTVNNSVANARVCYEPSVLAVAESGVIREIGGSRFKLDLTLKADKTVTPAYYEINNELQGYTIGHVTVKTDIYDINTQEWKYLDTPIYNEPILIPHVEVSTKDMKAWIATPSVKLSFTKPDYMVDAFDIINSAAFVPEFTISKYNLLDQFYKNTKLSIGLEWPTVTNWGALFKELGFTENASLLNPIILVDVKDDDFDTINIEETARTEYDYTYANYLDNEDYDFSGLPMYMSFSNVIFTGAAGHNKINTVVDYPHGDLRDLQKAILLDLYNYRPTLEAYKFDPRSKGNQQKNAIERKRRFNNKSKSSDIKQSQSKDNTVSSKDIINK